MKSERPTTKLLREARGLLARPRGWYKGWFYDIDHPERKSYCAVGALNVAVHGSAYRPKLNEVKGTGYTSALILLDRAVGEKGSIVTVNDDPKTRKKDVLEAFDKAIELSLR